MKKRIMTAGMLAMILAMGMTACANADTKEKSTTKKEQVSESDEKKEQSSYYEAYSSDPVPDSYSDKYK